MALHNFSLLHPAILIRYAFCPHIVYTRVEIMHLYAVETCRSIRRRQRLSIEKAGNASSASVNPAARLHARSSRKVSRPSCMIIIGFSGILPNAHYQRSEGAMTEAL